MGLRLVLAGRQTVEDGAPAPALWMGRVEQWLRTQTADTLEELRFDVDSQGRPNLFLRLHPAADDVAFAAADGGRLVVAANTYTLGPGYHRYLCDLLHRLGGEFGVSWLDPDVSQTVGDPTGFFHTGDVRALEENMLAWLSDAAEHALAMHHSGRSGVALSLRFGHSFDSNAPLLTPMGPRDAAWLERVRLAPEEGRDVFPWWSEGTGGPTQLGRALTRLWTEMVWRPPLLQDERRLFEDVALRLESAYRDDPSLQFPWHEWREVLAYLGRGGTISEEVARRAAEAGERESRIGYRRRPVRVLLEDGWSIRIPGALNELRLPNRTWLARDHRRTVRFSPLEPARPGTQLPEGDRSLSVVEHRGERVRSRALLRQSSGEFGLTALAQAGNRRALVAIQSEDPDDRDWVLETWRSLDMMPMA